MKNRSLRFYCFSPPVMAATFIIEASLLTYVLIRYKLNKFTRLVALLLFFLAAFQLAEYRVCEGNAAMAALWAKAGFVAITMLPPLGLHLALSIARRGLIALGVLAYVSAAGFIYLFVIASNTLLGQVCGGNYVIFQLDYTVGSFYYLYYYGWLLLTIALCTFFYLESKSAHVRKALKLLVVGYLLFLLPTAIINSYSPVTKAGVPSIMCGFALLFALILVFGVMPTVSKINHKYKKP